jgi:uncharacterized lipoprotein YmbA
MMRRRAIISLLGVAAVAGCASPNPVLYTLASVPGTPQGGGPKVVEVRDIGLPGYLNRPQIVRSSENYQLDVRSNSWWGDPLGGMLGRVIVSELSQRLPGTSVFSDSGSINVDPDATVEINLQRMDANSAGQLVFMAQVAVKFAGSKRGPVTRTVDLQIAPGSPELIDEVAAMSQAVGQLADTIAAMLRA